jgi:outer membrane receptor protein involved in Fe transport
LLLTGGNRDLAPERATSWSLSLALHPRAVTGLSFDVSYFSTRYRDRIVNPIPLLARALSDPLYSDQVTTSPNGAQQSAILAGADQFINAAGAAYDPARVVAIVNSANVNAGRQRLHGLDAMLAYRTKLGRGPSSLFASLNASYLVSDQQLNARQPVQPLAGTLFNPPHFRARATLGWQTDGTMISGTLSRIGGVRDTRTTPATDIAGMTMVDLTARRRLARSGPLAELEVTMTAQNVFNAKPASIATSLYYDTPYDSTNYSPFGRVLSIGISKKW